jgi:hypothetical protein
MSVPGWIGAYSDTSRRLVRLGHIAFIGLGIINILLEQELARSVFSLRVKRVASRCMIFGNIFLPITLFGAAAYRPLKILMLPPAVSVFLALLLVVSGIRLSVSRR